LKDIGADEYSSDTINRKPLTPDDVGPFAFDIPTSVDEALNIDLNQRSFILFQNYPNPFNPTTKIRYTVPNVGVSLMKPVQLTVYDVLGNEISTLVDENKTTGIYEIEFNASRLSSGTYFYQLKADNFIETKKMILMK